MAENRPIEYGPTAERIRAMLAAEPSIREVSMFGGLSFMVNDKMVVNVRRGGDLLVRVDPRRSPELVAEHGARIAEMGAGRTMGPSWLDVPGELTDTDDRLRFWIEVAMEFNDRMTDGPGTRRPPAPGGA
ncbi:MAG TPA: TfoX/Sxy family protein [Pseudonocardia sp.]|nr:TfoX/Sxy family protein [Pseudonocardia sp.]